MTRVRPHHVALAVVAAPAVAFFAIAGCDVYDDLPGRPAPNPAPVVPANTTAGFEIVWNARCAGCHGADGTLGAARPMNDADYLRGIGPDAMAAAIRHGVEGTRMPAFGGDAVDPIPEDTITAFVAGMYATWGSESPSTDDVSRGIPWADEPGRGDAARGETLFNARCLSCHPRQQALDTIGDDPLVAGSVTDPFYLRLVSDQHLRSSIVYGRADLGMPGAAGPFRGPDGKPVDTPLDGTDVDDLVRYLASLRDQWPTRDERKDGAP